MDLANDFYSLIQHFMGQALVLGVQMWKRNNNPVNKAVICSAVGQ